MSKKLAVITGAGSGIGKEVAKRLHRDGFWVCLLDQNAKNIQDLSSELKGSDSFSLDVSYSKQVDETVQKILRKHSKIDLLYNCAGIHLQKSLINTTNEEWNRVLRINLDGTFFMCRAVGKKMVEQESGKIINTLTKLGYGSPFSGAYLTSKNAVWGMTQCLAVEMAPFSVTVNAVAPGHVGVGTGMEKQFREKAEKFKMKWEDFEKMVFKTIPMGRWCTPEDVAHAVSFLASEQSNFITSEIIHVTGGFIAYGKTPEKEEVLKELE